MYPAAAEPPAPAEHAPGERPHGWGWLSWDAMGYFLQRRPISIWLGAVLVLTPLAVVGVVYADYVDYDFVRRLAPDAPGVTGTRKGRGIEGLGLASPGSNGMVISGVTRTTSTPRVRLSTR